MFQMGDPDLVDKVVHEVKSQEVFDQFLKDSIADVDTKPAYQNLRQRVDNAVKKFLSGTRWTPDMNKNQLREKLRRHIADTGFLDVGVERIVDQVVNPKIGSSFQPRIEEIAYNFLGLPLPVKQTETTTTAAMMATHPTLLPPLPPLPLLPPLPPLPAAMPPNVGLRVETSNLMPTDLEQVSPDSEGSTIKSDNNKYEHIDDDEESPPFEPLVAHNIEEEILTEQNMDLSNPPSPPPLPPPNDPPPPGVDEMPPLPPLPQSPPRLPPAPSPKPEQIKDISCKKEEEEK